MTRDIEDKLEAIGLNVTVHIGWSNMTVAPNGHIISLDNGHMWFSIGGVQFDSVKLYPVLDSFDSKYQYSTLDFNDYSDFLVYSESL